VRRSFARLLLGLSLTAGTLAGCNAIIGLKAPPEQDASMPNGSGDGSMPQGSDATVESSTSEGGNTQGNPDGSANGGSCTSDAACISGHCADGVCCNNACSGTCEACNLSGSMGTCTGIAVGTDPQMECVMVAVDAGTSAVVDASGDASNAGEAGSPGDAGSASDSGAAAEGGAGDGGSAGDAGTMAAINFPDGGYMSSDMACAGSCDGKGGNGGGSCTYPGSTKTCGTQFCNENNQAAGFACNGAGSCALGFTSCAAYSCVGAACGTTCTQEADCLTGYYCSTATGTGKCVPTFGDGLPCNSANECTSGFCTTGVAGVGMGSPVCCSSDCTISGGTCLQSGAVGECKCNVACDGGACQVFYQDADGDGYGNMNGDPTLGVTAYVGCSNDTVRAGFVPDHTDCDDQDPLVNPGQTAYFDTRSTGPAHTFDYNCDGILEKGIPEYPGAACEFCSPTPTCGATNPTCTVSGQQGAFACGPECLYPICRPPLLCIHRCTFQGCYPETTPAFTATVACGVLGTTTVCGTCGGAGEAAGTGTASTLASVQQSCH